MMPVPVDADALSTEALVQHFATYKELTTTMPAERWVVLLETLSVEDARVDRVRGAASTGMWVSFFVGLLSAFVAPGILPLPIFAFVISALIYFYYKSRDIHNNLRQFILPLVRILEMDLDTSRGLSMKIDLRGPMKSDKLVEENEGHSHKDMIYFDPWLSGEATLLDGSTLRWSVTDRTRRRRKVNPRGKIKLKFKTKRRYEIKLGVKSSRYRTTLPPQNADVQARVKQGSKRDTIRMRAVHVFPEDHIADIYYMTDLLSKAYGALKAK